MTPSQPHSLTHRPPEQHRGDPPVGDEGVVSYRNLLDLAHGDGLRTIRTALLQLPSSTNGNTAIVWAVVRTKRGTFTGLADANPASADPLVAAHLVALAETRAETRALRKALNVSAATENTLGREASNVMVYETLGPSDAQRRYLFQLLAAQGLDGLLARDFVHQELQVESLGDAPRSRIFALIGELRRTATRRPSHPTEGRPS